MSDTNHQPKDETWPDRPLTDNQQRVRQAAELIPVTSAGTNPENFAQLVDYCNWMSKAKGAVGAHLMGNVGACLAVMEIAQKFGMPGYMVARQTYLVNNQIAFMGQLIMAIINKHCPLERRLQFRFEGEGDDLHVIVTGQIKGETEAVEYTSPRLADIPVKNSPLWKTDPEQQFCYFGARRWQSRYWPEGLFGIYSPEELAENPHLGADNAKLVEGETLKEKLSGADRTEGHQPGFANSELNNIAPNSNQAPQPAEQEKVVEETTTKPKCKSAKKKADKAPDKPAEPKAWEKPEPKPANAQPTTAAEYALYASNWIEKEKDGDNAEARWDGEYDLRKSCGVGATDRNALRSKIIDKFNR